LNPVLPSRLPAFPRFERVLNVMSFLTLIMTIPQVWTIWTHRDAGGVSLLSWSTYLVAACLWFVYGLRKGDKTIYLACIGWIILNGFIVIGVLLYA
jgi:uncharacterized protein with PQ loop repeat